MGLAAEPPASTWAPEKLRQVELEGQLAKTKNIYLVLDPAHHILDIRARGVLLERVPLFEVVVLTFQPFLGEGGRQQLAIPAIWTVTQGPGDTDREVIAPITLKPYPTEEEEEAQAAAPDTGAKKSEKPEVPSKPSTYRVQLDNGWQIYVVTRLPDRGFLRRYLDSVRDGWLRMRGEEPSHPPLVTLVVSEEGAQRLHHLFKATMPVLVGEIEETGD